MTQAKGNRLADRTRAIVLTALAGLLSIPCTAEIKVIANPSVSDVEISTGDIKSVFLGVKTSLKGGTRLKPVLEKSGPGHEEFIKEYLGKTESGLQTYFRSLVFTGKASMPITLSSDAEMLLYVARTPGAIGYISADTPAPGVKTLRVR